MSSKWYVVQAMSGHEKKVQRSLEEGRDNSGMVGVIDEIVVPTENVAEVKRGEHRISEKRMWPGYVLVRMSLTDDAWQYIKNTNGVIGFLGGGKPTPLTDNEVGEILQEIQDKKDGIVQKHNIQVGDTIKIIDGVFVNFIGNVIEVNHDKGRLSAMVSIFGRETRVDDLEFWQVEEAPADAEAE
jgi:transcription termination/antitermination protein NusG